MLFGKKKEKEPILRLWDYSYANKFLNKYRNDIEFFELAMFHDREVREVFVEQGHLVKSMGAAYQMGSTRLDGTLGSAIDYPSIHVIYKGGNEEWIACYHVPSNVESYRESHRKLA